MNTLARASNSLPPDAGCPAAPQTSCSSGSVGGRRGDLPVYPTCARHGAERHDGALNQEVKTKWEVTWR